MALDPRADPSSPRELDLGELAGEGGINRWVTLTFRHSVPGMQRHYTEGHLWCDEFAEQHEIIVAKASDSLATYRLRKELLSFRRRHTGAESPLQHILLRSSF